MLPIASTVWVNCQQISEVHIYSMILYLLLYTHLRVTESWRGHASTIIYFLGRGGGGGGGGGGGHCILGLNDPGVQLFLGYNDQG